MLLVCKIDSLIGQRVFWKLLHQFIISCRLIIMVKDNWKENCRHILLLGKTKELLWNNVLIICFPPLSGFDMLQGQVGGGYSMSPCSDDSFLFQAGGVDRCLNQIYSIYLDSWCELLTSTTYRRSETCTAFFRTKCKASVYITFHGLSYLQSHS